MNGWTYTKKKIWRKCFHSNSKLWLNIHKVAKCKSSFPQKRWAFCKKKKKSNTFFEISILHGQNIFVKIFSTPLVGGGNRELQFAQILAKIDKDEVFEIQFKFSSDKEKFWREEKLECGKIAQNTVRTDPPNNWSQTDSIIYYVEEQLIGSIEQSVHWIESGTNYNELSKTLSFLETFTQKKSGH